MTETEPIAVSTSGGAQNLEIRKKAGTSFLQYENLVISAGPWSERVLSKLFPSKQVYIPFDLDIKSGNHLVLSIPNTSKKDYCDQVYFANILDGKRLDILDFLDGNL